ncbi:hypothetical protein FQN53_006128 [Emmonsiellopsis sp. PD_33]|nr:hypothetical protein FQN53_006128 [Emmonsiellopsis sp. PD_33]
MSSTNPTDHPPHLEPSQLGTKEYWESFYDNSLSHLSSRRRRPSHNNDNNDDNANNDTRRDGDSDSDDDDNDEAFSDEDSDPGTSWFSEHNAPEKVMRFLTADSFPLAPCNTNTNTNTLTSDSKQQQQPTILDLGTGNGSMLTLLRDEGEFTGPMVGVDYSEKSIELARRLHAHDHGDGDGDGDASLLRFEVWDVFDPTPVRELDWFPSAGGGFDIVLDKGTFDAISLSAEEVVVELEEERDMKGSRVVQRRVCERYPGIVRGLVRRGGFLVVTSCNWTEAELVKWFTEGEGEGEGDRLEVWGRVEYPKFRFGGQEGQGVCTVCFRRVGGR